jgi:hypothetical protein
MNRSIVLACLACSLAISGCTGSTEPRPTTVAIDLVELIGPTTGVDANGDPTISCEIVVRAVNTGESASWVDATFRTFAVGDPSTRGETTRISAEVIAEVWGWPGIPAGETQTSRWIATKQSPFSATLDFRYQPLSATRVGSSGVAFTCSP